MWYEETPFHKESCRRPMLAVLRRVQVHMPFHVLKERHLSMVLAERINPEISFDHVTMERYGKNDFRAVAEELRAADLRVTFHAPFLDLRPGALDPKIRQASIDRMT